MEEERTGTLGEEHNIPLLMPGEDDAPAAVVVAADASVRRSIALYLRLKRGWSVLAASSVRQALERYGELGPALLLLYAEPGRPRLAPELHAWREHVGAPAVVMVTEPVQLTQLQALRMRGACELVPTPVDADRLMEIVEGVLAAQASQR